MIEQRRTQRFPLRLPVRIVRAGATGLSGTGETVNMGSRGVLLAADHWVEVGESIEYTVALPPTSSSPEGAALHCLGKILRYEGSYSDPGSRAKLYIIAATIERHEFVRE